MEDRPRRPVALVGLMGAGKSAVARRLGERLGVTVADLDDMIEAEEGRPIARIFAEEGEPYFRRREAELLRQALGAGARVVACGGGVILDPANRTVLRERCWVIWLDTRPATAAARLSGDSATRPLLEGSAPPAERLAELARVRSPLYARAAHATVATDDRDLNEVSASVLAAVAGLERVGDP